MLHLADENTSVSNPVVMVGVQSRGLPEPCSPSYSVRSASCCGSRAATGRVHCSVDGLASMQPILIAGERSVWLLFTLPCRMPFASTGDELALNTQLTNPIEILACEISWANKVVCA
jgi:hypothetical protein